MAAIGALIAIAILVLHFIAADLGVHVLSDGKRTLTFIEMVHVGSPAYFERVRDRIGREGSKGSTYLYEGVTGTPEESAMLSPLIGFDQGSGSYGQWTSLFARVADLERQPQAAFLGLTGRPDVNADLSAGDLVRELTRAGARPRPRDSETPDFGAFEAGLREHGVLERGTVAHEAGRYLLRMLLKLRILGAMPGSLSQEVETAFRKRDEALQRKVLETPGDLVVTYGAAHYDALRELLGPEWKVVGTERNRVFE